MVEDQKKEEPKTKTAEQLKAENDLLEAELARQERLKQQTALAGTAGIRPAMPPKKEETPKEYIDRIYRGK